MIAPLANTDEVAVAQLWSSTVSLLDESGVGTARGPAAVDGSTVLIPAASEIITGVLTDSGAISVNTVDDSSAPACPGAIDHRRAADAIPAGLKRLYGGD